MEDIDKDFKNWNPMEEDYRNKRANCYREGIGQDLQSRDTSDVGSTSGPGGHKPVVLYITNIPLEMDDVALQNIFEQEGKVNRVHIPAPSPEKVAQFNSKIGFVTMDNVRGAQAAIENLNGFLVRGKGLVVKVKQSKEELLRRKEQREREEEFRRSLETRPDEEMDAGPSNGASTSHGESGAAESQRTVRNAGPSGDAASMVDNLSVTVNQDNRRGQDHRKKQGLLPLPNSREAAAAPAVVDSVNARRGAGPFSARIRRAAHAPSMAGSDVGSDLCGNCQKIASMRCKACRNVYYCNANCQRAHWPLHRRACTYDTGVPATRAPSIHEPDFDNMHVDISDDFIDNNQAYLTEWVEKTGTMSDSSSFSGDMPMSSKLNFFSNKQSSKRDARPGPSNQTGQQRSGQPSPNAITSPQENRPPRSGPPQQRQGGPHGMQGRDGNRPQPSVPEDPPGKGGTRPQSGGYDSRDRADMGPKRDGQGWQQGRKGATENMPVDKAGSFQPKKSPGQREEPKQFAPRNGTQDERANAPGSYPFNAKGNQSKNGPQEAQRNQPRNGPEDRRDNQSRNGPQGEKTGQSRNGPQQDKWGPGERGDKPRFQRGDNSGAQQNFRGPRQGESGQEQGGPGPRKADSNRGPPPNRQNRTEQFSSQRDGGNRGPPPNRQNRTEQFSSQRDGGNRGGPRNDRGPGKQQERRNYRDGDKNFNGMGSPKQDSWEEEKPKAPSKPTPALSGKSSAENSSALPRTPSQAPGAVASPPAGSRPSAGVSQADSTPRMEHPMDVVQLKKPTTVLVSHIESPQCFWVQMAEQLTTFVPIVEEAFAKYMGRGRPATVAEVGQVFVCEFMGELARAKVVSIAGSMVKIFYMDYGNSEEVQMSKLLPVPAELASLPPLSLPCTLMLRPTGGAKWTVEVVTLMQQLFSSTELCTMTVLKEHDNVCQVTLVRCSDGVDAATFLKEKGYCVDATEVTQPSDQTVSVAASRVMKGDMNSVVETLRKGQRVEVILMDFLNPLHLFVHIDSLECAFNQFNTKMVMDYNSEPPTSYQPVVGEMVVGRFTVDNCWYRAEVLEVFSESKEAFLYYVDFGNKEQLPFAEIRALKPVHAATPIHGINCALGGISATQVGQWQESEVTVFVSCIQKYLHQEREMPTCTMLVESVREDKVWVDMVSEELKTTLSQDLVQVLEGDSSAASVQPSADNTPSQGAATVPGEEERAPRQPSVSVSPAELKKATLPVGDCFVAGIQDIEHCGKFFINAKRGEEDLTVLREQLSDLCEGEEPSRPPLCQSVSAGDLVLVKFSLDDQWYRGQVQRVCDDGATCTIFFLDYGNKEDRSIALLRILPAEFLILPAQAVQCQLDGMPSTVTPEMENRFVNTCLQTESLVRVVSQDGDVYSVDIIADDVSVVTMLGMKSPATVPPDHPACVEEEEEEDSQGAAPSSMQCPPLEDADDHSSKSPLSPCPPPLEVGDGQVTPSSPHPPVETEERDAGSPQGALAYPVVEGGQKSGPALTRESLPLVAEDANVLDMVVTHVVNPAHFYAAHREHYIIQHDVGGLVPRLKEVNAESSALDHMPAVGELLSGEFEGEWFRCEVLEIVDKQVRVIFFDYGNEALLELSALHPLPEQLCYNFPLATIQCCLDGVSPTNGDSWDEESVALTQVLMLDQKVKLVVKAVTGGVHRVAATRVITEPEDGQEEEDVGQQLIQSGKAVSAEAQQQSNAEREQLLRQMAELQAKLAAMGQQ